MCFARQRLQLDDERRTGRPTRNKLVTLSNDTFQSSDCFYQGGTGEPIQQSTHRVCVGDPIGNFYG